VKEQVFKEEKRPLFKSTLSISNSITNFINTDWESMRSVLKNNLKTITVWDEETEENYKRGIRLCGDLETLAFEYEDLNLGILEK